MWRVTNNTKIIYSTAQNNSNILLTLGFMRVKLDVELCYAFLNNLFRSYFLFTFINFVTVFLKCWKVFNNLCMAHFSLKKISSDIALRRKFQPSNIFKIVIFIVTYKHLLIMVKCKRSSRRKFTNF